MLRSLNCNIRLYGTRRFFITPMEFNYNRNENLEVRLISPNFSVGVGNGTREGQHTFTEAPKKSTVTLDAHFSSCPPV